MENIHGTMGRKKNDEPRHGAGGCPVALGDTFRRKPSGFSREEPWGGPVTLAWTVIYINPAHRFFTAEAVCYGVRLRESFKF